MTEKMGLDSTSTAPQMSSAYDEAPPPSYESLYGKLKVAKAESTGCCDLMMKVTSIMLGTVCCTIGIGLMLALPISMVAIGSVYVYDCPRERYIPIYLIVAGCFAIVVSISDLIQRCVYKKDHNQVQPNGKVRINPFDCLINTFLLAWFIAGNVWIYRTYNDFVPNNEPPTMHYCHPTLYYFAFWVTTAAYILLLLLCCCGCVCYCIACIAGGDNKKASKDIEG